MYILVILILVVIGYFIYKKRSGGDSLSQRIGNDNLKANTVIQKKTVFDSWVDQIDLNSKNPFFSYDQMRLKCIQAGIRNLREQKVVVLMRFVLIIPFALGVAFLVNILKPGQINLILIAAVAGAALGFYFPIIRLDSKIKDRKEEINRAFPDFVDLMLVCVQAGMTAEQAYARISTEMQNFSKVMAEEIQILSAEVTYFLDARTAYENFIFRTQNAYVKAFCGIVLQSINYGTPLGQGLRAVSAEIRESQMSEIQQKAQSLPSKLTVPMMLFTMPVLFTVIIYPAAVQVMESF